jgi:hypothetical protein
VAAPPAEGQERAEGAAPVEPPPAETAEIAPNFTDVRPEAEQQAAATAVEAAPPVAAEPAPPAAAPPSEGQERAEGAAPSEPTPAEPPPAEIGAIEATEEEVERALERALVQTGALLLPAGTAEIAPNFTYVRQEAASSTSPSVSSGLRRRHTGKSGAVGQVGEAVPPKHYASIMAVASAP